MQQGKGTGPRPIQELLRGVLRDAGIARVRQGEREMQAWSAALGARAARAVPVRFQRGELLVEVDSAAHLAELKAFTGEAFRKQANQALGAGKIERVVYKVRG